VYYDYINAYLDFYICGATGSFAFSKARKIAAKYKDYPILHWRKLFRAIGEQLNEIDACREMQEVLEEEVKVDNFKDS